MLKTTKIVLVIGCFYKYAVSKPLNSKYVEEVTHAFADISKEWRPPKHLQTDQREEHFNAYFKKVPQKYNINHYNLSSIKKATIAEKVIRSLKKRLFIYFSLNDIYNSMYYQVSSMSILTTYIVLQIWDQKMKQKILFSNCVIISKYRAKYILNWRC